MATLKYEGKLPVAEVAGYGHFAPGDEKTVDLKTARDFDCDACRDEGWVVTFEAGDKKGVRADTPETNSEAVDTHPRGSRTSRKDTE